MYQQIKQLADDALAIQNKDRMDAALREISALAESGQEAHEAAFREVLATGTTTLEYSPQRHGQVETMLYVAHTPMAEQAPAETSEGGAQ